MENTEAQQRLKAIAERGRVRETARLRNRENMLALVKSCLTTGDHAGATEAARQAEDLSREEEAQTHDLFYRYAPTPTPCPDCGKQIPWEVNGYFQYWQYKCQGCAYIAIMADKVKRLPDLLRGGGVPARYWDASMDDFSPAYRKIDLSKGYFISGTPGTGKTHLMAAMFKKTVLDMQPDLYIPESRDHLRHAIYADFSYPGSYGDNDFPIFISVPELLLSIKSTFGQHDGLTEKDIIDKYSSAKVLFLDDLGAEYCSGWAVGVMFMLIDRRYNSQLLTHITSNLSLEDLAKHLENDRITSRISGMCEGLKMTGRDRRVKTLVRVA